MNKRYVRIVYDNGEYVIFKYELAVLKSSSRHTLYHDISSVVSNWIIDGH